jgi:hypothetical protein
MTEFEPQWQGAEAVFCQIIFKPAINQLINFFV